MKSDIDFLKIYKEHTQKAHKSTPLKSYAHKKALTAAAASILVCAGISCAFTIYSSVLSNEIKSNEEYFESSEEMARYDKIQQNKIKLQSMENYVSMAKSVESALKTTPAITAEEYAAIKSNMTANMSFVQMDYSNGVLMPKIAVSNISEIPAYVTKLRESGKFYDVTYNGYERSNTADGVKNFVVNCRLKGGAENEEAE